MKNSYSRILTNNSKILKTDARINDENPHRRHKKVEHGFKHIIQAGNIILADKTQNHFDIAEQLLRDENDQVRMLAAYLLRQLSAHNSKALSLLETKVADDKN